MSFYDVYNHQQFGGGGRGVSTVFVGSHRQRGHGLGSFFTGLFRSALPFLARGARVVGKEALRAGVNILDDIGDNHMTFKESFNNRMQESGHNLKRKATEKISKLMAGSGYKPLTRMPRIQSHRVRAARRTISKSRKKSSKVIKRSRVTKQRRVRKKSKKPKKSNKKLKNKNRRRRKSKPVDIFD